MLKKARNILVSLLRGTKCPDCKSRNVHLEKSTEIDPARIGSVIPYEAATGHPNPPMLAYRSMANCYQKVANGDIFKMYRDNYRCMVCNCEFKKRREILVARTY